MSQFSPGSLVVVLGAGATRGASFNKQPAQYCEPPLNTDFFTQLQRITTVKHQPDVAHVVKDVVELYGPNHNVTLKQYFTHLEAMQGSSKLVRLSRPVYRPQQVDQDPNGVGLGVRINSVNNLPGEAVVSLFGRWRRPVIRRRLTEICLLDVG